MKSATRKIAKERIPILFQQAKKTFKEKPQLAQRYIASARKVAMATRIRLPAEFNRQSCKHCNTLLMQGDNCRVRIKQKREPHILITCLGCGHQTRIPLRKKVINA